MEDLVPFLIFIIIAVVNVLKFVAEKGGKKKAANPTEISPQHAPSSFEDFFEDLAEKMAPKPTELPDWPEGRDRPNYLQEMEVFEEEPITEEIPVPEPLPILSKSVSTEKSVVFTPPVQVATFASVQSIRMRIPSVPIMRNSSGKTIDFDLKGRKNLKQAIIAQLIFSPPRAYDTSFKNTMAE